MGWRVKEHPFPVGVGKNERLKFWVLGVIVVK